MFADTVKTSSVVAFEKANRVFGELAVSLRQSVERGVTVAVNGFETLPAAVRESIEGIRFFDRAGGQFRNLARATYRTISSFMGLNRQTTTRVTLTGKTEPTVPVVNKIIVVTVPSEKTNKTTSSISSQHVSPTVIERTTERVIVGDITKAEVDEKVAAVSMRLEGYLANISSRTSSNATYINQVYNAVAATNNLDRADNLLLGEPRITGGSITGTEMSNIRGSFTGLSGSSLSLSGGLSIAPFSSNASSILLISTSTESSTSTALTVTSSGFLGLGTSSPTHTLSVAGDINLTGSLYQNGTAAVFSNWTQTGSDIYRSSNVGIGSTTPTSTLSVQGNSYVSGTSFFGGALTATSTVTGVTLSASSATATSTFAGGLAIETSGFVYDF